MGVRYDTLSKTSTINHFNQADIFRLLKTLKVALSEFQYGTISGTWLCIFAALPGILHVFNCKIPSLAFISCKDLIKLTEDESGPSKFQSNIGD